MNLNQLKLIWNCRDIKGEDKRSCSRLNWDLNQSPTKAKHGNKRSCDLVEPGRARGGGDLRSHLLNRSIALCLHFLWHGQNKSCFSNVSNFAESQTTSVTLQILGSSSSQMIKWSYCLAVYLILCLGLSWPWNMLSLVGYSFLFPKEKVLPLGLLSSSTRTTSHPLKSVTSYRATVRLTSLSWRTEGFFSFFFSYHLSPYHFNSTTGYAFLYFSSLQAEEGKYRIIASSSSPHLSFPFTSLSLVRVCYFLHRKQS